MLCSSWREIVDRLVSTLNKIHSIANASYEDLYSTHHMDCLNTKVVLYIRKVYYMNKMYAKLRHSFPSICEIEINRQNINPLQQTWNSVVPKSYKLNDHVCHSLSACSFPFFWCTFVTSRTTQLYFWRPLWSSTQGSRLVHLMVALALANPPFQLFLNFVNTNLLML